MWIMSFMNTMLMFHIAIFVGTIQSNYAVPGNVSHVMSLAMWLTLVLRVLLRRLPQSLGLCTTRNGGVTTS